MTDTITTQSLREGAKGGDPMGALVVEVSDDERDRCALRRATKRRAAELLQRAGVVVLKNAAKPNDVRTAQGELEGRWQRLYTEFIAPYERAHASDVGPRRFKEVVTRGALRYDMSHNVDFGDGIDGGPDGDANAGGDAGTEADKHGNGEGEGEASASGSDNDDSGEGGDGTADEQPTSAGAQLAELGVASSIVRRCLGHSAVPFGSGCVFALPGATDGPKHVDSPHLFDPRKTGADVHALDEITAQVKRGEGGGAAAVARRAGAAFAAGALPAHHVNVFVPLINLTKETGATRFVPGSHRTHTGGWRGPAPPDASLYLDHFPAVGDVILFDCRVYHMGTANRSSLLRPILYCTWSVPWFKEEGYFGTRSLVDEMRLGCHSDARVLKYMQGTPQCEDEDKGLAQFGSFIKRHEQQLRSVGLPPSLWWGLYRKLTSGVCDAGEVLALTPQSQAGSGSATNGDSGRETSSGSDSDGDGEDVSSSNAPLALVTTRPVREFEDVWLLEHVWTFEQPIEAAMQMAWHPQLLPLASAALGLAYRSGEAAVSASNAATDAPEAVGNPSRPPPPPIKLAEVADAADLPRDAELRLRAVRVATDLVLEVAGAYTVASGGGAGGSSGAVVRRFLLDTIGCHALLNAAPCTDDANFVLSGAFVHLSDGSDGARVYSLLWPVVEATDAGTVVHCDCSKSSVAGASASALPDEAWAHVVSQVQAAAHGSDGGESSGAT